MIHQFLMLKSVYPDLVNLIALVRDGRAVSKSMIRGDRKKIFNKKNYSSKDSNAGVLRAAAHAWMKSTILTLLFFLRVPKDSRYLIKYENMCENPDYLINKIASTFGIAASNEKTFVAVDSSHAIGGSPSRFDDKFKKVKIDERWRREWTKEDVRAFGLYGRLVNWVLGYK